MKRIIISLILILSILISTGCSDNDEIQSPVRKEIVVACPKDNTGTLLKLIQDFNFQSKKTYVKLLEFSNESIELHRVISSMLSGQEVQLDAMLIEDAWVGEFIKNNYLFSLCKSENFDEDEYVIGINDFTGDGKDIYWYPIILDSGIMYYRKDNVASSGKIDYIVENSGETYAVQGADGEEMLSCAMEFINLMGSVEKGLALYKKAIENSSSKDGDYLAEFKNGNAMYMRAWSSYSRNIMNGFSLVNGLVDVEVMKNSDGKNYAISRAYGYSVSRHTKNSDNCLELLEYLKSDEAQMQILKEMGTFPVKREHYKNAIILDYSDYVEDVSSSINSFIFRPRRDDYTFVSRNARKALNEYIQNDGSFESAIAAVEALLNVSK